MLKFSISVIIPAYNAEKFIEKAVTSALQQPEVLEVIIVNDGSTDSTHEVLERLIKTNPKIKIYYHQQNKNKGRSASRNLGIKKATCNYIAFLDADDYFLPNRFTNDIKLFKSNKNCDGVYNAVGFHFYRDATAKELQKHKLYTVNQKLKPEFLFEGLLSGKYGHFHIDGLTVKKTVFETTGLFNMKLEVAEDTDIFWRMALKHQLYTGIIENPVAIRGVHDDNVFENKELYRKYTIKMYQSLVIWSSKNHVPFHRIDDLLKWVWILKYKEKNKLYEDIGYWAKHFFPNPKLLFSMLSIKYFPIIRLRKKLFPFLYKQ